MRHSAIIFLPLVAMLLFSCTAKPQIRLPEDYPDVFTKGGRLEGFALDPTKNKFILYVSAGAIKGCLSELWIAKIDSIMSASPDWQFITILHDSLADTTKVIEMLDRFQMSSPVAFDPEDEFISINGMEHKWGELSYFINRKNQMQGMWLVGDGTFEKQFNQIKQSIR